LGYFLILDQIKKINIINWTN